MSDFATLVMSAQTTGLKTGVTDLDKLTKAAVHTEAEVRDAMDGIAVATGKVPVAAREAVEAFDTMPAATGRLNRGFTLGGNGARMMAQQLSQVGQQTMASGNFINALAIQLPDLGLAFGAAGAAAGLLAGIALPLLMNAFGGTDNAAAELEAQLDELDEAVGRAQSAAEEAAQSAAELAVKYGDAAREAGLFLDVIAAVEQVRAMREMTEAVDQTAESLGALFATNRASGAQGFLTPMGAAMELTIEQAHELQAAMENLGAARGIENQTNAAYDLSALLLEIYGSVEAMPLPMQDMAKALADGGMSAVKLEAVVAGIPGSLSAASGAAYGLAGGLDAALGKAAALSSYLNGLASGIASMNVTMAGDQAFTAALASGMDIATASVSRYRAEQTEAMGDISGLDPIMQIAARNRVEEAVAVKEASLGAAAAAAEAAKAATALGSAAGGGSAGVKKLKEELTDAQQAAKDFTDTLMGFPEAAFDDLSNWFASGFGGGYDSLFDGFKDTWAQMMQFAIANPIRASLFGTAASADGSIPAQAGLLGNAASPGVAASGFMGGISTSLGGGFTNMFNLSANIAAAGGGLGATLGALVGPLGLVLGLFSAFKKTTVNLAAGLQVTVDDLGLIANEFTTNKTTSFFGLISNTKTTTNAVDPDTQAQLDAIFGGINDAVKGSASALGIGAEAFTGFSHEFDVSLKGLTDEQAARAIDQAFGGMSDAMAEMAFVGTNIVIPATMGAADYLNQLSTSLTAVNSANKMLGFDLLNTNIWMGELSAGIIAVYGSIEEFTQATSFYFENFYSREEQIAALSASMDEQMAALGRTTPETMEGFRAMVDAAEAAGNDELAAGLIDLADEFANLQALAGETATAVDEMTAAERTQYDLQTQLLTMQGKTLWLRERELQALDPANRAIQEEIWALEDLQAANLAAAQAADELAAAEAAVAQERYDLQTQLYTSQGKTDLLRERELSLLDPTNAALQEQIWALEDLQAANEAAALAAEELAAAEAARFQEQYDLKTQLFTLQGKEDLLRERELALLDPTNQALQEQIWALEDLQAANDAAAQAADELAQAEQAIADERMSLQRELWTLQGDTASLRADELAGIDASNRALQEQIWLLEDQKQALEALDPNAYSTLFDFQKASALAANGYAANSNVPPAPQSAPVQTTSAATDPVVIELQAVKAAIQLMQTEQRDLNMQTATNTLSARNVLTKWDGDGLPEERTA